MSLGPPKGKGYAGRCETCDAEPRWSITRRGDAAVSWACAEHINDPLERMQRDHEITELVVRLYPKAVEWHQLNSTFTKIANA